jgi:hypothetical protein
VPGAAPPSTEPRRSNVIAINISIPNTHNHLSTFFTSSKLTMEVEGVSAPVGEPASKGGPQAEFHVPDRVSLPKTLKNALNTDIPPTAWACLWLSDIDKLKEVVDVAKRQPLVYLNYFRSIESEAKIVQKWNQRERQRSASSTPQQPSTPQTLPSPVQQPSPLLLPSTSQSEPSLGRKRRQDSDTRSVDSRSKQVADLVCLP